MSVYLDYFGLQEPPFRLTPQIQWFFSGAQRGPLLEALLYAITHDEGIIKVSGEVGLGKTMLCRMLLERLPTATQVIYLSNPSLSPTELLQTIALELGIATTNTPSLLREIENALITRYQNGQRVVAIIDEAHAMPRESLEQIRLLSNLESTHHKLLQLVLFGQPELDQLLNQHEMRSFNERITQHFALQPLNHAETRAYLQHRLDAAGYRGPDLFQPKQIEMITNISQGLTRRINILADKVLMTAFAEQTRNIRSQHILRAAQDARYTIPLQHQRRSLPWVAALLLALIIGAATLGWWLPKQTTKPVAQIPPQPEARPVPTKVPQSSASSVTKLPQDPLLSARGNQLLQESWLRISSVPATHYFLQLQRINASEASNLEAFIERASPPLDTQQLAIYRAKTDHKLRYGVIYGNFPTLAEASSALQRLPAWLRQSGAYPRQYSALSNLPSPLEAIP